MSFLTWKDEFGVNIAEIDEQHKMMLDYVNLLHDAVQACKDREGIDDVIKALRALIDYTRLHFATEEKYMIDHGYPEYSIHHKEHQSLLQQLESMIDIVSSGIKPNFCKEYDISNDWVICHILDTDKKLGLFLNDKNIY